MVEIKVAGWARIGRTKLRIFFSMNYHANEQNGLNRNCRNYKRVYFQQKWMKMWKKRCPHVNSTECTASNTVNRNSEKVVPGQSRMPINFNWLWLQQDFKLYTIFVSSIDSGRKTGVCKKSMLFFTRVSVLNVNWNIIQSYAYSKFLWYTREWYYTDVSEAVALFLILFPWNSNHFDDVVRMSSNRYACTRNKKMQYSSLCSVNTSQS